jgi:hypothetical protein
MCYTPRHDTFARRAGKSGQENQPIYLSFGRCVRPSRAVYFLSLKKKVVERKNAMFAPILQEPQRRRIHNEREYREWQRSLRGNRSVKRFKNEPGWLTRLARTIRRLTVQRPRPVAEPRHIEQKTSRLHG